jgi:hypothetical protein
LTANGPGSRTARFPTEQIPDFLLGLKLDGGLEGFLVHQVAVKQDLAEEFVRFARLLAVQGIFEGLAADVSAVNEHLAQAQGAVFGRGADDLAVLEVQIDLAVVVRQRQGSRHPPHGKELEDLGKLECFKAAFKFHRFHIRYCRHVRFLLPSSSRWGRRTVR